MSLTYQRPQHPPWHLYLPEHLEHPERTEQSVRSLNYVSNTLFDRSLGSERTEQLVQRLFGGHPADD
jgi:hypothetical protein